METGKEDVDSQGKTSKEEAGRARTAVIWTALLVCACAGFVLAQVGYIYARRGQPTAFLQHSSRRAAQEAPADIPVWHGPARSELERTLQIVAPPQPGGGAPEVLVMLCTYNLYQEGMLNVFLHTLLQSGVRNYLIIALDQQIRDHLASKGFNVYRYQVPERERGGSHNHAISALKFGLLRAVLRLGWGVLLADTDVVVLKNPFDFLYRDHDIEAMSDGFDAGTAFGALSSVDDPQMGWARYAQGTQHLNLNSGLFYARANARTVDLMGRVADRLAAKPGAEWDQSVFNQVLFFLSHGDYRSPGCSVRVMEPEQFMNSKVLFKTFRRRPLPEITGDKMPVMIHMNYHPDKLQRMRAAVQFFLQGQKDALQPFPGGSEPGS